ncbi:unnamed protein product [Moneuplotes crassus]|uniref:Scaffold protein Nfu/NifU N-terminal domain-containing protein n=1 Tax=Euplotes crassus TaxID=5936 RepID=A0AAD1XV44_EUPCR|nr:unnamed protein product [Moneuplotes crassus]
MFNSKSSTLGLIKAFRQTPNYSLFMTPLRCLFIQTKDTPNPDCMKFYPGKNVMESPGDTLDFSHRKFTKISPLAIKLFSISGVRRVFYAHEYLSVTKEENEEWEHLTPEIYEAITDHYTRGLPIFTVGVPEDETVILDTDSEAVQMIKEILITRIRPFVQNDGGDVAFKDFDPETGKLTVLMKGSCAGCPSSQATLKGGIEKMMKFYVEEVTEVEGVDYLG